MKIYHILVSSWDGWTGTAPDYILSFKTKEERELKYSELQNEDNGDSYGFFESELNEK